MELIGLLLAIPVTLLISAVFCVLAIWALRRFAILRVPVLVASSVIFCSVVLEIILSFALGPLALHNRFGSLHSGLHFANFVLAAPAVACLILVAALRRGSFALRLLAICVCWFTCMASLLSNIVVYENIYGVDGSGTPPTQSRN